MSADYTYEVIIDANKTDKAKITDLVIKAIASYSPTEVKTDSFNKPCKLIVFQCKNIEFIKKLNQSFVKHKCYALKFKVAS